MSKKIETVGKVYQTTYYDQFKRIDGNRQIKTSGKKWRLLLESIRDHGQMAPAIVNGRNEIIDGQHRLEACRICGQPFKYVVNGGAGFNDIPEANLGDQWKLIDKINQNTHRIPSTTKTLEYLDVFGEIYNKGRKKDQRVYLDTDYERGLYVTWEGAK